MRDAGPTATTPAAQGIAPAPRWAGRAAHAAALTTLPSGIWRLLLAAGAPVGYTSEENRRLFDALGMGSLYLVALSVLLELAALATVILVRPWGERLPTAALILPAGVAAALLSAVWGTLALTWWTTPGDGALTGTARAVVGLLYVPLAAWGPLLGAVTYDRWRRGRRAP